MSRRRGHALAVELSEVLNRRSTYEVQLERYARIYKILVQDIAEDLKTDEETVLHAIYIATYVISSTEIEERMADEKRIEHVARCVVEGLRQTGLTRGKYVPLLKLTHEVAIKAIKLFLSQKRLEFPLEATQVDMVDTVIRPLFEIWYQMAPDTDLRWIMAELDGPLRKRFSYISYEELSETYPVAKQSSEVFFDSGLYLVDLFIEYWQSREGLFEQ